MTSSRRRVVILGSTGSIGRQALDVVSAHPDRLEAVALVAGRDEAALAEQAAALGITRTGLGAEAAEELAGIDEADIVLNGIVGVAGLRASIAALEAGKTLALANKESLVAGGEACLLAAERGGGRIIPVDSEHAALYQCLQAVDRTTVARIVITASGGPFRTRLDMDGVTPAEALRHPTWSMGPKNTIDSATLMNKALEVIEAHYLFGFDYEHIDVVVHPQSIVHGIVEFIDGSMMMQAAPADMRIPIQAALSWPELWTPQIEPLDLTRANALQFEAVDEARFPAVRLGHEVGRLGRSFPAALNAANEEAVKAFLDEVISYGDIVATVKKVVESHEPTDVSSVEAVLDADGRARESARRLLSATPAGRAS